MLNDVHVSPFILARRCTINFADLSALSAADAVAAAGRRRDQVCAQDLQRQELADALFDLVTNCERNDRRSVLALKRAVHNHRAPADEDVRTVRRIANPVVARALDDHLAGSVRDRGLQCDAERAFDEAVAAGRTAIAELARREIFLKGLQVSGPKLVEAARRYSRQHLAGETIDKASRKMEARLVSFLYRTALKPSPFGTFTEFRALVAGRTRPSSPARHYIVISRMLLLWVVNMMLTDPALCDVVPLRRNPLLHFKGDRITYFRRGDEGAQDMFGRERFVSLARLPAVERLMALVEPGIAANDLVVRLGGDPVAGRQLVAKLVDAGALERTLAIPDQTMRYAHAAALALAAIDHPKARTAASIFAGIDAIEADLGEADVELREALVDRLHGEIGRLCMLCDQPVPAADSIKTYFYEQVVAAVGEQSPVAVLPAALSDDLVALAPVIGLFDEMLVERLALAHFYRETFGFERVGLLTLYKAFSSLDPMEIDARMAGRDCPEAATVIALRGAWIVRLRACIERVGDIDELDLRDVDPDLFAATMPSFVGVWDSTSFYLQPCSSDFAGQVVLNGATAGHGAAIARFCPAFPDTDDLAALIGETERRSFPGRRVADLTSVLGTNTNLHPPIWPTEIEYPGSTASPGREVLHLHTLQVSFDPASYRLMMTTSGDDRPVSLASLNALYPAVGPGLYRFLSLLSPYGNFRSRAWLLNLTDRGRMLSGLPRLRLGRVVLQRRCRVVPPPAFRDVMTQDPMTLAGLVAYKDWASAHDLPMYGFYSGFAQNVPKLTTSSFEAVLNASRKTRLRKPHFYDFTNPFLMRTLRADLKAEPDYNILVEECLPDARISGADGYRAEEFIVQVDRPTAAR